MKISPVYYSHPFCCPKKQKQIITKSLPVQNKTDQINQFELPSFKAYPHFWFMPKKCEESVEDYLNFNLNFVKDDSRSSNEYANLINSNKSMQAFASDLYMATRLTYYSKGGITNGEFVNLLKKQKLKDIDKILLDVKRNKQSSYPDVIRKSLEVRHGFFKYLIREMSKLDPKGDFLKNGDDVMIDIASSYYKIQDENYDKYNQKIKDKLEYSSKSPMKLLDIEKEVKKLSAKKQNEIKKKFNGDYEKMMRNYIAEGCIDSRSPIEYSEKVDTALIHMLPRYVQHKKNKLFKITPLTRRLRISDMDNFMKQFRVGSLYSYPRTQSCSKGLEAAETWFSDDNRALNVIFRIHPKSKETKAFDLPDIDVNKETNYKYYDDLHERKFRSEVLYPPNAKFKVLGSHKYIKNNYSFWNRSAGDYYKTIIDLQEV